MYGNASGSSPDHSHCTAPVHKNETCGGKGKARQLEQSKVLKLWGANPHHVFGRLRKRAPEFESFWVRNIGYRVRLLVLSLRKRKHNIIEWRSPATVHRIINRSKSTCFTDVRHLSGCLFIEVFYERERSKAVKAHQRVNRS